MNPNYEQILVTLSVALGLSFLIERILQVIKTLFDRFLFAGEMLSGSESPSAKEVIDTLEHRHQQDEQDTQAEYLEEIKAKLKYRGAELSEDERIKLEEEVKSLERRGIDTSKVEQNKRFSEATVYVEPAKPGDRVKILRTFWLQILGTFSGVLVCYFSHLGILAALFGEDVIPLRLDYILTGILIGAGSQPIHFLIQFLTKRKISELKTTAEEEVAPEVAVQPLILPKPSMPEKELEIEISYEGGVDREKLENVHLRPSNPDLIVYHHTAMHSDTTFADVVKVIKDKGWLTGYHCVVLKDGSIYPFCRWDRYGNHAKGFNHTSLGIAFNGNFEPDPRVPFANVNGKMGLLTPTDEQLRSAAKVVALWTFIYDIPIEFDKSIIPHNTISDKTCPGSNFPYEQFQHLIPFYCEKWKASPLAMREIEVFKQKPFLKV
jgi:uncharacterized membrane protein YuzA (DUF378 family)